jgi:hypothetical protein
MRSVVTVRYPGGPGRPLRRLTRDSCSALTDLVTRNAIPITIALSPTTILRTRFFTKAYALTKKAMPANMAATPKSRARNLIKYTRCFSANFVRAGV